jgi:hypothetical protein
VIRYIFYTTVGEGAKEFSRLKECPGVVMTICVDEQGRGREPDVTHIRLYKPVSSATAFTIIETPFRRRSIGQIPHAHDGCDLLMEQMLKLEIQVYELLGRPPHLDLAMARDCRSVSTAPLLCPVSNIRKVILVKGAHLHGKTPARLSRDHKFHLRLHNAEIEANGMGLAYEHITMTYIELIKLAGMQVDARNLFDAEQETIGQDDGHFGREFSRCTLQLGYTDWHLRLVLTLHEAKAFVDKVSVFPLHIVVEVSAHGDSLQLS